MLQSHSPCAGGECRLTGVLAAPDCEGIGGLFSAAEGAQAEAKGIRTRGTDIVKLPGFQVIGGQIGGPHERNPGLFQGFSQLKRNMEATGGFEPPNRGFAVLTEVASTVPNCPLSISNVGLFVPSDSDPFHVGCCQNCCQSMPTRFSMASVARRGASGSAWAYR